MCNLDRVQKGTDTPTSYGLPFANGREIVNQTAFPATPQDVVTLTMDEFACDLDEADWHRVPSMDRVCRVFVDDANRALVWWIRFGAFRSWCATVDVVESSTSDSWTLRDAWEVAASFPLNHLWEFDPRAFASAVETVAVKRVEDGRRSTTWMWRPGFFRKAASPYRPRAVR